MKKLFLSIVLITSFSYAQVTDENGTIADGSSTILSGNIGIGTTPTSSSQYKLEVNGQSKFNNSLLIGNPSGARTEINLNNNHKVFAATNKKTIDLDGDYYGGGFVGVYRGDNGVNGVYMESMPTLKHNALYVGEMRNDNLKSRAIEFKSRIFGGDTEATNYIGMNLPNSVIVIGDFGWYKKGQGYGLINKLKTNFMDDVYVETGNVGIGTDSFVDGLDTYRLSVEGKVRAHSVKVYTSWADFVFEEDYNLPTLQEVEQHIKDNGHLKDIPSAKEVEGKGIDIGEMNKLLLQKIEELTLYTIQQEKRLKALEAKLDKKQ